MRGRAAAAAPCRGVRGAVKTRLLVDMLDAVPGGFKVLVADSIGIGILNSALRMHELMEHDVTLVEAISNTRQPLPSSNAIYFVSPSMANADYMIHDWATRDMYAAAYIFFTSTAPDEIINHLAGTRLATKIQALKDLLLDFFAPEVILYNFAWKYDLPGLFGPAVSAAKLHQASAQLFSLLQTFGEKDAVIRYQNSDLCRSCAARTQELLTIVTQGMSSSAAAAIEEPAIVLILDRSIDVSAPLLHELTYQAMLNDLMPLKDGVFVQQFEDRSGKKTTRSIPLDEEDPVWCELRHQHIAVCMRTLSQRMERLLADNPQLAGKISRDATLTELGENVRNLPKFQEEQKRLSVHIDITTELFKMFTVQQLRELCDLEQRIVTEETADGDKCSYKELYKDMLVAMKNTTIPRASKFRLMIIFIVCMGSQLSQEKREELLHIAGLGAAENHEIENLSFLSVSVVKEKQRGPEERKISRKSDDTFPLSRYEPQMKIIVDQLIRGVLSPKDFPFVREPRGTATTFGGAGAAGLKSLRTGVPRFTAALTRGGASSSADTSSLDLGHGRSIPIASKGRVIVCILGGVADSEVRATYELVAEHKKEIIVGGTSLANSNTIFEQLPLIA